MQSLVRNHCRHKSAANNRRRGAALLLAIAALFIVGGLSVELIRTKVRSSRAKQEELSRLQANWLADAGCNRAASRLRDKGAYKGETWEIPATELAGVPGRVEIRIAADSVKPRERQVTVTADFPRDLPHRHRVIKTIVIETASSTP